MENIIFDFINMLRRGAISEFDDNYLSGNKSKKTFSFDELFENNGSNSSMNFFPSDKKGNCHEIAMFVSFHKPIFKVNLRRNQMVSLDEVLKKLVQQVLGTCYPKNKKIILLTDKIDTDVFEPWIGNLKAIKKMGMELEVVYLRRDGSTDNINQLIGL
jgi:hypothetical protein